MAPFPSPIGKMRFLLRLTATFTLLFLVIDVLKAQPCFVNPRIKKITADVSWAIKSYLEYKPIDYDTEPTKKYALLVYIGGTGEMFQQPGGDDYDLCPVLQYSMPWRMNVGHFPNVVLDQTGQLHSYLVVMPFVTQWEQQYSVDPGAMIDYALQHYAGRIDVSRIYLTAMSRGTDNIMGYVTSSIPNAKRIAAAVPVGNCFPSGTPSYSQQVGHLAGGGVHLWGIQCAGDLVCSEFFIQDWVNSLNEVLPGYGRFSYATFACDTEGPDASFHYAWNHAYDPEYRPFADNKNVYEWMIQFTQTSALPIVLKDWNARLANGKVLLDWTTSEEFNTKEFIIQRASSTGSFENILSVAAAGSSTTEKKYALVDDKPLSGLSLYRLVLKDLDGKEQFFAIKRILAPGRWTEQVIIPNPVRDGSLTVYMNIDKAQEISIRLLDVNGRLIKQQSRQLEQGMIAHEINVAAFQKGIYLVQVIGKDFTIARKIWVQ